MVIKTGIEPPINIGDVVRVIVRQEYWAPHPSNILGVVRKIYYDGSNTIPSAYGIEACGEIIFYLADQIEIVPGVEAVEPDPISVVNRVLEDMLIDSALSSYF